MTALLLGLAFIYSPSAMFWKTSAAGTISGTVYVDYNMNGARDTSGNAPNYAVDKGVGGVTVTAYAADGTSKSATTNSGGTYSINTDSGIGAGPYRIEFTNLPNGFFPSAIGTNNATTVRFTPNSTTANVDLGINQPDEYCQNNPFLVSNSYVIGSGPFDTLFRYPYDYGNELDGRINSVDPTIWTTAPSRTNNLAPTGLAQVNSLGATFGLAWDNGTNNLYASAYIKRSTRLGSLGNESTGAIYKVANANSPAPTSSLYVDLNTIFGAGTAGANPHPTATTTDFSNDLTTNPLIGKRGLGSLKLSQDKTKLYTVNLADKRLYVIPTSGTLSSTTIQRFDIPNTNLATANGNCPTADVRPFAVGRDRVGQIYVGAVCSAESQTDDTKLFIYVWRFNGAAFTLAASNNLTFTRSASTTQSATWQRWADLPNPVVLSRTAPMLTDIEFDGADMILGLRDRYGDQISTERSSRGYGDIMRVCSVGGVFTFENNGSCGGVTAGGPATGQGIGGGEYYDDLNGDNREEGALGGLVQVPGFDHVVTSFYDPVAYNSNGVRINNYYTGGIQRYSNTTGAMTGAYDIYLNDNNPSNFGKADGVGDTDVLCNLAPIQIGNRVWNDANSDGKQNSNEAGIQNVAVQLWEDTDGNGSVDAQVAAVNTNANGEYYFGGANCATTTVASTVTASADDAEEINSSGVVLLSGNSFDIAQEGTNLQTLGLRFQNLSIPKGATITSAKLQFTTNTATTNETVNVLVQGQSADNAGTFTTTTNNVSSRSRTSAAVAWNGIPQWTTVGESSARQMTPDVSAVVQEIVNRGGWASGNSLALIITDNNSTSGASRSAYTFDSGTAAQRPTLTVTYTLPNADCYNVKPNTKYEVRIPAANFNAGQSLNAFSPTTAFADATTGGTLRDSDGIVVSGNQVIAALMTGNAGQSNHTYDFGFVTGASYSIGNRVWYDTNNNGRIDAGELGVSGASVSLTNTLDVASATQNTDGGGYYRFDNQTSATYRVRTNSNNFANGAIIAGYRNSSVTVNDKTTDSDGVNAGENGINPTGAANSVQANGIRSGDVTLNTEPTGETDLQASGQGNIDSRANMTVDFGFYKVCVGGTMWSDVNNNGLLDAGEIGIANLRVQIYDSTTNTEIPVGPDGILGTADDAANGMLTGSAAGSVGNYNFCGLLPGTYRIVVTPGGNTSSADRTSTANPDNNTDNDDNGIVQNAGVFNGKVAANAVTVTPGSTGAAGNKVVTNASGSTVDPTVDFGFVLAPTAVDIANFEASTNGQAVVLNWSTGNESSNLGFNIYREIGGVRELLNAAPIAGTALRSNVALSATGEGYSWTDKTANYGAVYYLEDLDLNGTATMHGPISPLIKLSLDTGLPKPALISDLNKSNADTGFSEIVGANKPAEKPAKKAITKSANKSASSDPTGVTNLLAKQWLIAAAAGAKISIKRDGWYRVSAAELQAANFDVNSNRQTWQLFADAVEVPMKTNDDGSIEFFGRGLDTATADSRTYYLINNGASGLRLKQIAAGADNNWTNAPSFAVTARRQDRTIYSSGILNGEADNWFGAIVNKTNQTVQTLTIKNPDPNQTKMHVSVTLQGLTMGAHQVNLSINNYNLGTVNYTDTENRSFDFDVPANVVQDGANNVVLQAVGEGNDVSFVDTIELNYLRRYVADANQIHFTVPANQTVRVSGFSEASVRFFEIENGRAVRQIFADAQQTDADFSFGLGAEVFDREIIAVADSINEQAASVRFNQPSSWNLAANQADFVILTNDALRPSADTLAAMREQQGLRTRVVLIDDVFDEFSFGEHSPEAVRYFLKQATTRWQTKPRYALLFGDSHYDSRNRLNAPFSREIIPMKSVDTDYFETGSDAWLADFNDDGIEDIALGRIPAATPSEAEAVIAKLVRYDNQPARTQKSDVLIADGGFENYSATLQTLLPPNVAVTRIDRAAQSDAQTRQAILTNLNASPMVVTYTGHGSTLAWSNASMFLASDAANLTNDQLSFYVLMTCLNGFTQGSSDSLAEAALKSPNGAAAVWASTGITEAETQFEISRTLTAALFAGNQIRLGDAVKQAKQGTADVDVRRTYHLIGDPTLFFK